MLLKNLKEGDRVLLKGSHPWATHAGTIVGWEFVDMFGKELPEVQLDEGPSCFVFSSSQVRKTKGG